MSVPINTACKSAAVHITVCENDVPGAVQGAAQGDIHNDYNYKSSYWWLASGFIHSTTFLYSTIRVCFLKCKLDIYHPYLSLSDSVYKIILITTCWLASPIHWMHFMLWPYQTTLSPLSMFFAPVVHVALSEMPIALNVHPRNIIHPSKLYSVSILFKPLLSWSHTKYNQLLFP